ncbi:translation initiation factor IF-2-like [Panicum virgatum]|uniref:translation initiation factor IF-2-like n=1 Tax=Panicum virgatum TaxID=38727 RepID=UPI0019D50894|nr:translation initiation factor IF-2-like [Panicum virgatum]
MAAAAIPTPGTYLRRPPAAAEHPSTTCWNASGRRAAVGGVGRRQDTRRSSASTRPAAKLRLAVGARERRPGAGAARARASCGQLQGPGSGGQQRGPCVPARAAAGCGGAGAAPGGEGRASSCKLRPAAGGADASMAGFLRRGAEEQEVR